MPVEQIESSDRYGVLGIPYPNAATMCTGDCEGTGIVPVCFRVPAEGMTTPTEPEDEAYREAWEAAELAAPASDGYHFLPCKDCGGTGKANSN